MSNLGYIKGKSMITLTQVTPVNVTDMSVLELLTVFSRLPWRKCTEQSVPLCSSGSLWTVLK